MDKSIKEYLEGKSESEKTSIKEGYFLAINILDGNKFYDYYAGFLANWLDLFWELDPPPGGDRDTVKGLMRRKFNASFSYNK